MMTRNTRWKQNLNLTRDLMSKPSDDFDRKLYKFHGQVSQCTATEATGTYATQ